MHDQESRSRDGLAERRTLLCTRRRLARLPGRRRVRVTRRNSERTVWSWQVFRRHAESESDRQTFDRVQVAADPRARKVAASTAAPDVQIAFLDVSKISRRRPALFDEPFVSA